MLLSTFRHALLKGSGRRTAADRKRYIDIAIGSLFETHSQLIIVKELNYITKSKVKKAEEFIEKLKAKLIAYQKSIKDRPE